MITKDQSKDLLVTLTIQDLSDLIYYTVIRANKRSNENLYKGLMRGFLDRFDADLGTIIEQLDDVKELVKSKHFEKVEIDYDLLAEKVAEEMKDALEATLVWMKDDEK